MTQLGGLLSPAGGGQDALSGSAKTSRGLLDSDFSQALLGGGEMGLGLLGMVPGVGLGTKVARRLPMDDASRMQRAKDLGFRFDKPAEFSAVPSDEALRLGGVVEVGGRRYYGTTHAEAGEAAAEQLGRSVDAVFVDPTFRSGFDTTAGRFVDREEANVISRRTRQGGDIQPGLGQTSHGVKAPESDVAVSPTSVAASVPGSPGGLGVWGTLPPRASDASPSIAVPLPRNSDVRTLVPRASRLGTADATGATNQEVAQTLMDSWKEGYDVVVLKNHPAPGRDMLVVKDPAQLRDPETAAFDPKKRDLADISAALLGGLGLGWSALDRDQSR